MNTAKYIIGILLMLISIVSLVLITLFLGNKNELPYLGALSGEMVLSGSNSGAFSENIFIGTGGIYINSNWSERTLRIQDKIVTYHFGSGNPKEVYKSRKELLVINEECGRPNTVFYGQCTKVLGNQEIVGGGTNNSGVWEAYNPIPVVTPKLEEMLHEFLSNLILRESAEKCGKELFSYDQAYSLFGPDVGEYSRKSWWNPYRVEINDLLTINSITGRKEYNSEIIWSLLTQISIPSQIEGGEWYTNVSLRKCLQSSGKLDELYNHVAGYYSKLQKEYYFGE